MMYHNVTILINGIAAGLFGLTAVLFLFVFKRTHLRTVLGIILAIYALYLAKDIAYAYDPIASDGYLYRMLLSIDNWVVPLYVIYAVEVLSPGKTTLWLGVCLELPFLLLTVVYSIWPVEWVFNATVAFSSLFSAICALWIFRMTFKYRRRLMDNCSDITNMDIRWMWVSIAIFLPNLLLWTLVSARLDYVLDALYYITLSVSWGIVAWHTYFFVPQGNPDTRGDAVQPMSVASWNFTRKLNSLAADGYFVRSPRLTLSELAAELGTNRTTLSNYLNQELGTTFYDYINSHRITRAEELLSEPSNRYSAEQLAELSGFNSLSTFRRAFFKKHGLSPGQYRERVLERR